MRDAILAWLETELRLPVDWHQPVVGETSDATLNDIAGARSGSVSEGNTGGGTGMICHGFEGGTGTASRRVTAEGATHTVGVLVQANYGSRRALTEGSATLEAVEESIVNALVAAETVTGRNGRRVESLPTTGCARFSVGTTASRTEPGRDASP